MNRWQVMGSVAFVTDRGCVADAFYAGSPEEAREYAERMNR